MSFSVRSVLPGRSSTRVCSSPCVVAPNTAPTLLSCSSWSNLPSSKAVRKEAAVSSRSLSEARCRRSGTSCGTYRPPSYFSLDTSASVSLSTRWVAMSLRSRRTPIRPSPGWCIKAALYSSPKRLVEFVRCSGKTREQVRHLQAPWVRRRQFQKDPPSRPTHVLITPVQLLAQRELRLRRGRELVQRRGLQQGRELRQGQVWGGQV